MTENFSITLTTLQTTLAEVIPVASDRKLRLFCCACCRRFWDRLDAHCRHLIENLESYSDGATSAQVLRDIRAIITPEAGPLQRACMWATAIVEDWACARQEGWRGTLESCVTELVQRQTWYQTTAAAPPGWSSLIGEVSRAEVRSGEDDFPALATAELRHQLVLAEDIFGNLFNPESKGPLLLASAQTKVSEMAATIYDHRQFSDLPTLADALEEAGYTDPSVSAHCRDPNEHVRGCWVIDLLLRKQ